MDYVSTIWYYDVHHFSFMFLCLTFLIYEYIYWKLFCFFVLAKTILEALCLLVILIETKIKFVSLARSVAKLKLFISVTLGPATVNICEQHFVEWEINNFFGNHIFFFITFDSLEGNSLTRYFCIIIWSTLYKFHPYSRYSVWTLRF